MNDKVPDFQDAFADEIQAGGRDAGHYTVTQAERGPNPRAWIGAGLVAAAIATLSLMLWDRSRGGGEFVPAPRAEHPHTLAVLPIPGSSGMAVWLGTHNGLFLRYLTPDAPAGWRKMSAPLNSTDVMALGAAKIPGGPIYAAGHSIGVQRSDDNGTTWRQVMPGMPARDVHALAVDPQDASRVYIWAEVAGMFASSNGGATWETLGDGKALKNPVQVIALAVSRGVGRPSRLYAGTNLGLYISSDAGESWFAASGEAAEQPIYAVLPVDDPQMREIYAGTATGALYSSDGGGTWQRLEGASRLGGIGGMATEESSVPQHTHKLLAVNADIQVFTSDDHGRSWKLLP